MFTLFVRFLPMVAIAEVKSVLPRGSRPQPSLSSLLARLALLRKDRSMAEETTLY